MGRRAVLISLVAALCALLAQAAPAGAAGRCGDHPWCDMSLAPDVRAGLLLGALTEDEKISLLAGDELTGVAGQGHTGTSAGVPRLGVPTIYYSDGPAGPRQGEATPMPAPIGLAATFSEVAAAQHAGVVADEVKKKGNDVVFAPTVNILRTPLWGRAFETYGEDPYLSGRMAVAWIRQVQRDGVIGNVKHYAVNNQEGSGGVPPLTGLDGSRFLVNAVLGERTLREIYLPQFEGAVREAGVGSVMCSYPRVNGQYACENEHLLERILKREWGFGGYVLADYGAAHNTVASLNNGLDFEPWPGLAYSPALVRAALSASLAGSADLDDHVRRILRTLFAFGAFDRDAYRNDDAQIDKQAHAATGREVEEQAITLLKNEGPVLPIAPGAVRSLALIGADAGEYKGGGGSAAITPFFATTPRQGIEARAAAAGVEVRFDDGSDPARAAGVARGADMAVVVVADAASEGGDKECMSLDCDGTKDRLVGAVAAANGRTVVVLETGAPVLTPWRDAVPAILEAWYPGVEGGTAIARVLFGDVDPGGRLPATFPASDDQEPYAGDPEAYPGTGQTVRYKEGVLVGYRWFDARALAPAFPFGHGLSYTSFRYGGLSLRPGGAEGALATASVPVRNTGTRAGTDVAQLYLGLPEPAEGVVQPPRQLKGFEKVALEPGDARRVRFAIDERALSYWDEAAADWRVAPGCYRVMVGRSSRDVVGQELLAVGGAACPGAAARILLPPSEAARGSCRRLLVVRLRGVGRSNVRRVIVLVGGRRRATLRGGRSRVRVRLVGRPGTATRVRLVIRTADGRTIRQTRRYRACV